MLRFLTAGESHGPALTAVIEGVPAGLKLSPDDINKELARRQLGFGRGGRMKIERDKVQILSGVRFGETIGSPISLKINNRDWDNWRERMPVEGDGSGATLVTAPRPGHADLSGILKTGQSDIRNILERASARETAARVAVGAVAKRILQEINISIISHVVGIGPINVRPGLQPTFSDLSVIDESPVRCFDKESSALMVKAIESAREKKDTVGGVFEVLAFGVVPGLGGYRQWDERLNANLARALMSIPAIKAVEVGDGMVLASRPGSEAHDEIFYDNERGYWRETNHGGGIEGGMSNGETLILRAGMKPIPTLGAPLKSVDIQTKAAVLAGRERSDICAVPAAAVIGEHMTAIELAKATQVKFGGDSMAEFKNNYQSYIETLRG